MNNLVTVARLECNAEGGWQKVFHADQQAPRFLHGLSLPLIIHKPAPHTHTCFSGCIKHNLCAHSFTVLQRICQDSWKTFCPCGSGLWWLTLGGGFLHLRFERVWALPYMFSLMTLTLELCHTFCIQLIAFHCVDFYHIQCVQLKLIFYRATKMSYL